MSRRALDLGPQVASMRCAFMDAGDVCGVEREGNDDGGAREGKLAKSRAGREAEALTQQPVSKREVNGRKGICEQGAVAPGKPAASR